MGIEELRLGLIVPSSNTTMEDEFRKVLPQNVLLAVSRVKLERVNVSELLKMKSRVLEAAELLVDADVDIVVFGCTSGSLVGGKGYDEELSRMIEDKFNVKALTTSTAVIEALKSSGARKISVATPYIEDVNLKEKLFLEANGFKVLEIKGLNLESNLDIGRVKPEAVYSLALRVDTPKSEAVFISCTNLRTFEIIQRLEETIKKPVITSNQATLWASLRRLKVHLKTRRLGSLFKR